MRSLVAWALALLVAGWTAMRLLGLDHGFPLVQLVAFTPFAAAGAVAITAFALLLRRRAPALLAAMAALALAAVVAPRALGGPTEPAGDAGPALRVVTANMHFGDGSAPALVALVRRSHADVLSVQELTPQLVVALNRAGLGDLMPHYVLAPDAGAAGTGLYARAPLRALPRPRDTHNPMATAAAQVRGAGTVQLVAVHTAAPTRGSVGLWDADLGALPPAASDGPLRIMAGDFNATLDHANLRRLIDTGYADAAAVVGAGLHPTWPEGRRLPPAVAIDHVLADERVGVRAVSVHTIPGTDHRAVFAELVLPRR
jgi:endonuclease/exonuclease/phosphatase (EEP) superfamily protein YafD